MMDVPAYVRTLARSNPDMPIFVESISNSRRPIPYLTDEYWRGDPDLNAADIVEFLRLCRPGRAIGVDETPPEMDSKEFDRQHPQAEFLKSIE